MHKQSPLCRLPQNVVGQYPTIPIPQPRLPRHAEIGTAAHACTWTLDGPAVSAAYGGLVSYGSLSAEIMDHHRGTREDSDQGEGQLNDSPC